MEAIDYCIEKSAAQGTPGYYSVLFQPPPIRAALISLRALERELNDVVELCTDRDVARRKLDYWQQELQSADTASPHPVTVALHRYADGALNDDDRARLLSGIAQRIMIAQPHHGGDVLGDGEA